MVPRMASISSDERLPRKCSNTLFCSSARTRFNLRAMVTTSPDRASSRSAKRAGSAAMMSCFDFFLLCFSFSAAGSVTSTFAATSAVLPARSLAKMSSTPVVAFGFFSSGFSSATGTSAMTGSEPSPSISGETSGTSFVRRPRPNKDTTFVCVVSAGVSSITGTSIGASTSTTSS